jgi:hypothetical protein
MVIGFVSRSVVIDERRLSREDDGTMTSGRRVLLVSPGKLVIVRGVMDAREVVDAGEGLKSYAGLRNGRLDDGLFRTQSLGEPLSPGELAAEDIGVDLSISASRHVSEQ